MQFPYGKKTSKFPPAHSPNIPIALKVKMLSEEKNGDQNNNILQCICLIIDLILHMQRLREVHLTCPRSQQEATNRPRPPGS